MKAEKFVLIGIDYKFCEITKSMEKLRNFMG
jgi:glutaredoxin-related protein